MMAAGTSDSIFIMHGARAAVAGGMVHIEEQVKALELAVVGNVGLAFDLAKTLIESACKTVITERGGIFDRDDDVPKLLKAASLSVPFLPPALASEAGARKSLAQTLSGLSTAVQGVCELRNAFGFASHGSDGARPVMEGIQALLVAQAADAIIGFLYRVHRQDLARPRIAPLRYEDNPAFNSAIDDQNGFVFIHFGSGEDAYTLEYDSSRVLFDVDIEAYRNALVLCQACPAGWHGQTCLPVSFFRSQATRQYNRDRALEDFKTAPVSAPDPEAPND